MARTRIKIPATLAANGRDRINQVDVYIPEAELLRMSRIKKLESMFE